MTTHPPSTLSVAFTPFGVADIPAGEGDRKLLVEAIQSIKADDAVRADLSVVVREMLRHSASVGRPFRTVSLKSGMRYRVDMRDHFGAHFSYGVLQEAADFNVFCRMVRPGMIVVDVGANFGLYTVQAAQLLGGAGKVYAFEPVPSTVALLKLNVAENTLAEIVRLEPQCVGDTVGTCDLGLTEEPSFSGVSDTGRSPVVETIKVSCTTLDEYGPLKNTSVDLMKIDVEGAELGVLKGAAALIDRSTKLVIQLEVTPKNLTPEALAELMAWFTDRLRRGYAVWHGAGRAGPAAPVRDEAELRAFLSDNFYVVRTGSQGETNLRLAVEAETRYRDTRRAENMSTEDVLPPLLRTLRDHMREVRGHAHNGNGDPNAIVATFRDRARHAEAQDSRHLYVVDSRNLSSKLLRLFNHLVKRSDAR